MPCLALCRLLPNHVIKQQTCPIISVPSCCVPPPQILVYCLFKSALSCVWVIYSHVCLRLPVSACTRQTQAIANNYSHTQYRNTLIVTKSKQQRTVASDMAVFKGSLAAEWGKKQSPISG